MEFGSPKCGVLIMKRGKVVKSEVISIPDGKECGCKYLGTLESDSVKHEEIKYQMKKKYIRKVRNILKSKLNGGNIILTINSRPVSTERYGAGIINWTWMVLEQLDWRTRKLMTMYGAHHPKSNVDRLYLQRC